MKLKLPKHFQKINYYGYGPTESYCDKHHATFIDKFTTTVDQLHEDYIKPQENGSHYYCSFVQASSQAHSLTAYGSAPFSFNASNFTIEELSSKKYNFELAEAEYMTLCIDYMQSGVGSNSCGPELLPQYRLDHENIQWEMGIVIEDGYVAERYSSHHSL